MNWKFLIACLLFSATPGRAEESSFPGSARPLPDLTTLPPFNGVDFKEADRFWEKWRLVSTRYRKDNNQLRLVYANPIAWEAMSKGAEKYPDGSIFAKSVFVASPDPVFPSSLVAGGFYSFQLMKKDQKRYKDSDGWGYALAEGALPSEKQKQLVESCHACHRIVGTRDFVFSTPIYGSPFAAPAGEAHSLFEKLFKEIPYSALSALGKKSFATLGGAAPAKLRVHEMTFFTGQRTAVGSLSEFALKNKIPYLVLDEKSKKFLAVRPSGVSTKECRNEVRFSMSAEGFADGLESGRVCDGRVNYEGRASAEQK